MERKVRTGRNCWRLSSLDRQVVLECIEAGMRQKDIAANYGISRGYVAMLKMRYGIKQRPDYTPMSMAA